MSGSRFEIDDDANLKVDDAANLDWLSPGGLANATPDDSSGANDSSFAEGTHENDLVPTVGAGSIPPNKSDLKSFGLYEERNGDNTFLNVYWARVTDPSGDTNMDFEFNTSAVTKNDPADGPQIIPVRTTGDLLLTYDLTNGGTVAVINARFWLASKEWGPATNLTSVAGAIGRINTSTIPAAQSGGLGDLSPRTFGEASINLEALLPVATVGCRTFGSVYLKSRASQSFNATLKDFIPPKVVSISNCGKITVHKQDDLGNDLAGAVFTLYNDQAKTSPVTPALSCTTDASGDCTIVNVPKGSYWLHETGTPTGYDTAAPQPVTITAGDQVVPLTFVDPRQLGTITVTKNAVPDDPQDFTFSLGAQTVTLDDDGETATTPNSKTWTVPVGTYTLTETDIPTGWTLTGLSCTGTATTSTNGAAVTITLAKDQTAACSYTDTFTPLNPNLATQAAATGNGTWNDTATLTGDGTHPVEGTVTFFACAATATPTGCAAGTQVGSARPVVPAGGASYTATTDQAWTPTAAGWTCFRAVFLTGNGFYASGSHTNTTTECFLKQAADLTITKTALPAYGRAYTWDVRKVVDAARVDVASGSTATSTYDVTVSNRFVDSTWSVSGTITVHNPNPVPFDGVDVTEAITGGGTCAVTNGTNRTVPAGGDLALSYSCTYAGAPSANPVTGTSTATWSAATYFTPTGSATKTADSDFTGVTPTTTDEVVTVVDSVQGTLGTLDARTAKNPTTFHYTVDRTGRPGTCTSYPNTATTTANDSGATSQSSAEVVVCTGVDLTAGVTGTATKDRDDLWSIAKRVDATRVEMAQGGTATFTYQVEVTPGAVVDSNHALTGLVTATNPNDWEAVTATLTVSTDLPAICTVTDGVGVSVPASGSVTRGYSCTFTAQPPSSGTVSALVSWSAAAAKTPGSSDGASQAVTFAIGSETHKTVTVVDDKTDPANPVTLGTRNHADGPFTYTYSLTKSGVAGQCTDYTNTARLTETAQTATRTVTVCVGLDLAVSKTALATDHRTYLWALDKAVDKPAQSVAAGQSATFGYTVTARPVGTTDDGWSVTGEITVTNPNAWRAITATVTDVVDSGGGASCVVGNGTSVTVPASGTVRLPYTCTFTSKPADGTNTATATWDAGSAATPHGSATGTAPVVFVPTSSTNETITVVDDKTDPANPVTLGTATYGAGPTTFVYTVTRTGTAGRCTTLVNTAKIVETSQTASRSASLCVGQALGLSGTGAGSFDRDHLWTLTKSVDRTTATVTGGDSAAYAYTVTATPAGVADSGYELSGTGTLVNPNDWEAVTATITATTDLATDATCTVTDGAGRSVPAAGSMVVTWSCAFPTAPKTTGTVTLAAAWDAVASASPVGTVTTAVPVTLVLDQVTRATVSVTDDQTDPANPKALGTAVYADGPAVFTYSLTKTATAGQCSPFTNVATIAETGQTATATAEVCGAFTGGGGGTTVTPPAAPEGGGQLTVTGDMTGVLGRWALAMLVAGAVLLLTGRRRRQA